MDRLGTHCGWCFSPFPSSVMLYADKSLFQHGRYLREMSSRKMYKEGHAPTSLALGALAGVFT
jgi:hypothetical protein